MKVRSEPVETICPKCIRTQLVCRPEEEMPVFPRWGIQIVIRELLDEGKSH